MKNTILVNKERKTYQKTKSGKSWSTAEKNITIENQLMNYDQYITFVDSIPFFNSGGSYCKGTKGYESIGYMINEVVTILPYSNEKKVDTFTFIQVDMDKLYEVSGTIEARVLNDLKDFKLEYHQGKEYTIFNSYNHGSFMVDLKDYKIVG